MEKFAKISKSSTMTNMPDVKDIISLIQATPSKEDVELVTKAYEFAQTAHSNHKRYSGEPYFIHLVETAKTLAEFGMGSKTIAAGLLHDSIEDTEVTEEIIKLIGGRIKPIYGPLVVEPKNSLSDITKAKNLLNWEPKISFEDGLKESVDWFRKV